MEMGYKIITELTSSGWSVIFQIIGRQLKFQSNYKWVSYFNPFWKWKMENAFPSEEHAKSMNIV